MDLEDFQKLRPEQQWAMLIGRTVRNGLEYLHAGRDGKIPESAMPELNRRLRFKILQTVYCLMHVDNPGCAMAIARDIDGITEYSEVPEFLPIERQSLDNGGAVDHEQFELAHAKRKHWYATGEMPGD